MPTNETLVSEVSDGAAGERIIRLRGPLVLGTMFDLQRMLRQQSARWVIVDMAEVPYVDSAGIGVLVNAHVSCTNAGRKFAVAGVNSRARAVLTLTRVDSILTLFDTVQDAQKAATAPA